MRLATRGQKSKTARLLKLDRTCLYRKATKLEERNQADMKRLKQINQEQPFYGVARLAIALHWSEGKTRRIRNLAQVTAARRAQKRKRTRFSEIEAPSNLLAQYVVEKVPGRPDKGYSFSKMTTKTVNAWVQDFTYIYHQHRYYYLAAIKSLYSRQIVGWSISNVANADLVCAAFTEATNHCPKPKIVHNDRGTVYLSKQFAELCKQYNVKMSASAPGSPYQNGFMESFFNTFKAETMSKLRAAKSFEELTTIIAKWIYYYNSQRIHTALKTTPDQFALAYQKE